MPSQPDDEVAPDSVLDAEGSGGVQRVKKILDTHDLFDFRAWGRRIAWRIPLWNNERGAHHKP